MAQLAALYGDLTWREDLSVLLAKALAPDGKCSLKIALVLVRLAGYSPRVAAAVLPTLRRKVPLVYSAGSGIRAELQRIISRHEAEACSSVCVSMGSAPVRVGQHVGQHVAGGSSSVPSPAEEKVVAWIRALTLRPQAPKAGPVEKAVQATAAAPDSLAPFPDKAGAGAVPQAKRRRVGNQGHHPSHSIGSHDTGEHVSAGLGNGNRGGGDQHGEWCRFSQASVWAQSQQFYATQAGNI